MPYGYVYNTNSFLLLGVTNELIYASFIQSIHNKFIHYKKKIKQLDGSKSIYFIMINDPSIILKI